MKKTIYCSTVIALAALVFAACTRNATEAEEVGWGQKMHVIPLMASGNTGFTEADDIQTFMLRISGAAKSQYNYYAAMTLENGEWKSKLIDPSTGATGDGFQMLWANTTSPVTAAAIFCNNTMVKESDFPKLTIEVPEDQTSPEKVKATDWLYMAPKQFNPADRDVTVEFAHMMAKLTVKVTLDDEFNAVPGTQTNPIERITVGSYTDKFDFMIDEEGGQWWMNAVASSSQNKTISPCITGFTAGELGTKKAVAEYECLMIPWKIPAGYFTVKIEINGTEYEWKATTETQFEVNHSYELALNVGTDKKSTLARSISVKSWKD